MITPKTPYSNVQRKRAREKLRWKETLISNWRLSLAIWECLFKWRSATATATTATITTLCKGVKSSQAAASSSLRFPFIAFEEVDSSAPTSKPCRETHANFFFFFPSMALRGGRNLLDTLFIERFWKMEAMLFLSFWARLRKWLEIQFRRRGMDSSISMAGVRW